MGRHSAGRVGEHDPRLDDLVDEHGDRPWCLVEPGGNLGDRLITLGFAEWAGRIGLRFRSVSSAGIAGFQADPDEVVYIHGSGGFVPWWSGRPAQALQRALRTHGGPIIVGPSSFADDPEFLEQEIAAHLRARPGGGRVILLARERASFDLVRAAVGDSARVGLEDDTALRGSRDGYLGLIEADDAILGAGGYRLTAIRRDRESRGRSRRAVWPPPVDPAAECRNVRHWIRLHARATEIVTDRLHSAILGAVLGVPTILMPGDWHKNRGVWEHSLRDRGVGWADSYPATAADRIARAVGLGVAATVAPVRRVLLRCGYRFES